MVEHTTKTSGAAGAKARWSIGLLLALSIFATGCIATSSDNSDSDGNTSRTIREEASTTLPASRVDNRTFGPLPDPKWIDADFELQPIAIVDTPMAMATRAGADDLWIAEREGRIRRIERRVSLDKRREEIKLADDVVLDISDKVSTEGEGGLLGLDFSLNGRELYVSYTDRDGDSVVAEYKMDTATAQADTERILLEVDQPHSNHNGGQISLGPDGFLYIALGDGGSSGDPDDNGQNLETLLGTILRIDPASPSDEAPYGIPGGNPFFDRRSVPNEVWLSGVRNPWRFSFDMVTGDLWVADVGQNEVEEVTFLSARSQAAGRGANLGWRTMEGDLVFDDRGLEDPTRSIADYVPPVHTYAHTQGRCSVTGGYVYRGARLDPLRGVYLYADWCSGAVAGLEMLTDGRALWAPVRLDRDLQSPTSFGQDAGGEMYVLEAGGDVLRIQGRGWRRSTRFLEPNELFAIDNRGDILPGDGYEEQFDDPVIDAPPPIYVGDTLPDGTPVDPDAIVPGPTTVPTTVPTTDG